MNFTHRIRRREDGMTLLEVLSVVAILGILATSAYAVFVGGDESAMDTEAKSNARSLLWKVHAFFPSTTDYTLGDEPTEQEPPPGVTWGDQPGEVYVVRGPETTRYTVTVKAVSKAVTDGHNHVYTIVKDASGPEERTCEAGDDNDTGGCSDGAW